METFLLWGTLVSASYDVCTDIRARIISDTVHDFISDWEREAGRDPRRFVIENMAQDRHRQDSEVFSDVCAALLWIAESGTKSEESLASWLRGPSLTLHVEITETGCDVNAKRVNFNFSHHLTERAAGGFSRNAGVK
jgi:hypothetical protein